MADLKHEIGKTKDSVKRMKRESNAIGDDITDLEKEITATKKDMAELLKLRTED